MSAPLADHQTREERLARARVDGDLPAGADPVALARYVTVVSEGQAVHAAAGATREELRQSAAIALKAFEQFLVPTS